MTAWLHLIRPAGIILALQLLVGGAAAGAEGHYQLGTGDRLRIVVFEKADLSGDFSIGPGASLSLPMLGRIAVGGMTLEALERDLVERLLRTASVKEPRITIEVLEYRPFFILGAVETPGNFAFVEGITVLHAIAIAGGFRRTDPQDIATRLEAARARERVLLTSESLAQAHARRSRLVAERDGARRIEFPSLITELVGPERTAALAANETSLMEQRTRSVDAEYALLEAQKGVHAEEIQALEGQAVAKERLAEFAQQEMAEIEKLRQRDLVPLTRVLALRRQATEIEGDRAQLRANIARAKQEIAKVDLTLLNVKRARAIQVAEGVKLVDDELVQLAINRRSAMELLGQAESALGRTSANPVFPEQNGTVVILRRSADGMATIAARDDTPVLPGDLIKVPSRLEPGEDGQRPAP